MNESSKKCFKCEVVKPLEGFYRHSAMSDGRLGKCKECAKVDVRENYKNRREYYRDYDRHRAMLPHRVAQRMAYQQTDAGKMALKRAKDKWQNNNQKKRKANCAVNNAVRSGRLSKPNACEDCNTQDTRIHGHHDDYAKPLDVRWLCPACHTAWHRENGEAANG